jgi:hypothetical protein
MAAGIKTGGRQKGTPNKATADIKALAQEYTPMAMEALLLVITDSDSDAARVSAIKELFDRGYGKSRQALDVEANVKAAITRIERQVVRPPNPNG